MSSTRGHLWYNMVLSVLHELYHGIFIATDRESEMGGFDIEEACNEMADDALTTLAREFDIEPASMAEEPFFGPRYMQFFIREIQRGKGEWCERQLALHDDLHIHYDDKSKEYIQKFRTFIRFTHGGDMDQKDPRWDAEAKPLDILLQDDPHQVVVETAAEAQTFMPEIGYDAAIVDAKPVVSTLVGGHGLDDEAIAMSDMDEELGGESSAYIMEDYDMLPPEAAGFNAQLSGPVEHVQKAHVVEKTQAELANAGAKTVPSTSAGSPETLVIPQPPKAVKSFCTKCGSPFALQSSTMQFCGGCGNQVIIAKAEPLVAQTPVGSHTEPHRGAPGQQLRTGLTNHNLEPMRFRSIVESILHRAYTHLFNKCGYSVMANPAFDNNQKWAVLEPVYVGDLPDEDLVLIGHDIFENNLNRINVPITDGYIRGFVTKGGMLPCYTLYFNANGQEIKRVLLPTNPWKQKAGAYSKPALRAQQGAIIAWIMDGDDSAVEKWRGRIEDSIFIWS